jgi:hypothetical protein
MIITWSSNEIYNHTNPKQRFLPEEFSKNATATPDVNRWTVPLLAQQQLRRSIP